MSADSDFRRKSEGTVADAVENSPTQEREESEHLRRWHGSRRAFLAGAGLLVVAAAGGTTAVVASDRGKTTAARISQLPAATATITRGDIVDTQSVDGTLTYASPRSLYVGASGVVTWAPAAGSTVSRGEPLLTVDNKPVILMYGPLPMWRTLSDGVADGPDIRQLKANLQALGFGDFLTVDDDFTVATTDAVESWQHHVGLTETGSVDTSQVVFQPNDLRIAKVNTPVGSQVGPGGPALSVTSTERLVYVALDAAKQDLVKKGNGVTVQLPDGKTVPGVITSVGAVATQTSSSSSSSSSSGSASATIDVYMSLTQDQGIAWLDQAPVTVNLSSTLSSNVLSVPIVALLALSGGGFGVQVVQGGTTRIVPVQTSNYGGDQVEISGPGLRAGMTVGVASS